jgi:hypothetical protein
MERPHSTTQQWQCTTLANKTNILETVVQFLLSHIQLFLAAAVNYMVSPTCTEVELKVPIKSVALVF